MPESRDEAILAAIGLLAVCAVMIYSIITAPSLVPKSDSVGAYSSVVETHVTDSNSFSSAKININTADIETLKTLYSIGDTKAQAIIDYRRSNGGFNNVEEIKTVAGIGDKLYDKIKDYITV